MDHGPKGAQTYELSREAIWQVTEGPCHAEFISCLKVDFMLLFFQLMGGGSDISF